MDKLTILIAGRTASGKSSMMSLLERLLLKEGFEVEMNFENELYDYETEEKFRRLMRINTKERENAIKKKSKICIKTIQTSPEFQEPNGDPNCPLCSGSGRYSFSTFDGSTTTTRICDCVRFKYLKENGG